MGVCRSDGCKTLVRRGRVLCTKCMGLLTPGASRRLIERCLSGRDLPQRYHLISWHGQPRLEEVR